MTSEQKLKRALAALDSAVQEWYAEHNPKNQDRYGVATFMNMGDGAHASRITLNSDPKGAKFIDIASSKQHYEVKDETI